MTILEECLICNESVKESFMGTLCQTCNQKCCIQCEVSTGEKCPFCRKTNTWSKKLPKIGFEKLKHYVCEAITKEHREIVEYEKMNQLFVGMLRGNPTSIQQCENLEHDDDLQLLARICREYIYILAQDYGDYRDIDAVLTFMDFINSRISDPMRCIDIDPEEIDQLVDEDIFRHRQVFVSKDKVKGESKKIKKRNKYTRRIRPHYRVLQ